MEEPTLICQTTRNSAQHQGWVLSGSEFIRIKEETNASIASLVSLGHKIKSNHKSTCLGKIMEVILLCGAKIYHHVAMLKQLILHSKAKTDVSLVSSWST